MRPSALLAVCATVALLPLAGCAVPPALSIASLVVDGIAVVTTGKSMSDHAISNLSEEDCRMSRLLKGEWICHAETKVVAAAELPPAPPEPKLTVVAAYPRYFDPTATARTPAPPPAALAARPAPAPAVSAAEPMHPKTPPAVVAPAAPTPRPAPAMAQIPAVAPPPALARPATTSKPTRSSPPTEQASLPSTPTPAAARALSNGSSVHGEMVIQGGTNAAEAETIASQLKDHSAKVRPVQKDGVTVYEVVVGISG